MKILHFFELPLLLLLLLFLVSCGKGNGNIKETIESTGETEEQTIIYRFSDRYELNFYDFCESEKDNIVNANKIGTEIKLMFKDAVFDIRFNRIDENDVSLSVLSADIYGNKVTLKSKSGNSTVDVQCCVVADTHVLYYDGVYIVANLFSGKMGDTWIFSEYGVYETHSFEHPSDDGNSPVIWYTLNGDGTLRYDHYAEKYYNPVSAQGLFQYCTGRDEFCCEYGTVTFYRGLPVFKPEKRYSLSEKRPELDKEYELIKEEMSRAGYASLDEMIAGNANKYERYDPEKINNQ